MKPAAAIDPPVWVHLSCACWTPELRFAEEETKEPVVGFAGIDPKRAALLCAVCGKKQGACVQCGKAACGVAFHPECARLAGLYMEVVESRAGELNFKMYCEKHRPLKMLRGMEQSHKRALDEVYNLCKVAEKCGTTQERLASAETKRRRRRRREKPFSKQERGRLLRRIREICQGLDELAILVEKEEEGQDYRLVPSHFSTTYNETLSKRLFPWGEVKLDRFSPEDCYAEYLRAVPDEETFLRKVLLVGKRESRRTVHEVQQTDQTLYCVCRRRYHEVLDKMIGMINAHNWSRVCGRAGVSLQRVVPRGLREPQGERRGTGAHGVLLRLVQGKT